MGSTHHSNISYQIIIYPALPSLQFFLERILKFPREDIRATTRDFYTFLVRYFSCIAYVYIGQCKGNF